MVPMAKTMRDKYVIKLLETTLITYFGIMIILDIFLLPIAFINGIWTLMLHF